MHHLYEQWIQDHYPDSASCHLKCAEATLEMCAVFPELKRVRGYVMVGLHERPHWWCKDIYENIIDPTVKQFDCKIYQSDYEEYDEGMGEPHGKCLNCGELLFESKRDDSHICRVCMDAGKNGFN